MIREAKSVLMTSTFYGYNHNDVISNGEMYDMRNMSGDDSMLLSMRKPRGITSYDEAGQEPVMLTGIHGRDNLVFVRGADVYYNFIKVTGLSLSTDPAMLPKKIVSMGAYVCIWPDKMYFNTADLDDKGSMERLWSAGSAGVSLIMCRGDGTNYDMTVIDRGSQPPADPQNGSLWLDESGSPAVLRQYALTTEEWAEVLTTFVKIQATGIGAGLKEFDVIDISGLELGGENPDPVIYSQVSALNGQMIVYAAGTDYIVVVGLLSAAVEEQDLADATIHADLTLPELDYVCESNNRLWGCRYGSQRGQFVNEIYASALGSFRVWNRKIDNSQDSYTAQVGTDGPFTGAIAQRGYPVFFKENCIHRVSGLMPTTYQVQTTMCRGVQQGSWRSLCVVAENIYYKSREGIMVYDGNMPQLISTQLGEELYSDARAGVLGDKYYISMMDNGNLFHLFVYDTKTGIWWKEDNAKALGFGAVGDELYFIDELNNTLVSVCGTMGTAEGEIDWNAVFELYGVNYRRAGNYDDPRRVRNEKYISMFKIRMELGTGASAKLYIQYNGGEWEDKGDRTGNNLRTFVWPVIPRRCDHVRFKLQGHGPVKVFDISRIMEVGGDG